MKVQVDLVYVYPPVYSCTPIRSFSLYLLLAGKWIRARCSSKAAELNLGCWSWETSAAQLCWIAGNPGVQHNSNIQFLFHIRKYFLIITAGVLEWFPRWISASQMKRQGGLARLFPAFRRTPWEGLSRVALVNPCRWKQPHPNYF